MTDTEIRYIHSDHLHTPRAMTDRSGTVVWRWQGDAFGQPLPDEDPDGDGTTTSLDLRFPGQLADGETGTHYNYFKDYDPSLGRYVQSDPVGLQGGSNTYAYALNHPTRVIDLTGQGRSWRGHAWHTQYTKARS